MPDGDDWDDADLAQNSAEPSRWIIGTIVARNYLPAAYTLAASLKASNPHFRFAVLLVDAPDDLTEASRFLGGGVAVLGPRDLAMDEAEFIKMASIYDVTELCTALKPWLLETLLLDHEVAIYLDPDIEVYDALDSAAIAALEHTIALTPHVLEPIPRDGLEPTDVQVMSAGTFNLGFIGISRSADGLLRFWKERLRRDAISAQDQNLFTDQRWIDNVPALFRHTVLRDETLNVAYWNVFQRKLEIDADGRPRVHGAPVGFYHFSGYSPDTPWLLSKHFADRARVLLSAHPDLRRLCDSYGASLRAARAAAGGLADAPYGWARMANGRPLTIALRRYVRAALIEAEAAGSMPPPMPLAGDGSAFVEWMLGYPSAAGKAARMNRAMHMQWLARPDVQRAFPDLFGIHAEAFRAWCATEDARAELPVDWLDTAEIPAPPAVEDRLAATVVGYLDSELGVGQIGRIVVNALRDGGIEVASRVEPSPNRALHPFAPGTAEPTGPITVFSVNADQLGITYAHNEAIARDRYRIGVWAWELEEFPPTWDEAFDLCDEIWAISDFTRDAIVGRGLGVPVHTLPVPLELRPDRAATTSTPGGLRRSDLGVPDDDFLFLFAFDAYSVLARKNPLGVIDAFHRAFPTAAGAHLLIKMINGTRPEVEQVRIAAAATPGVTLFEGYISPAAVDELYSIADCYVSLHRAEGFGLTIGEAMAAGLPVIISDYSAPTEFVNERTGLLVPGLRVPVGPGAAPYDPAALWFEPDLDAAADHMARVVTDPQAASALGRRGQAAIREQRSPARMAEWVAERVRNAHESWRAGRAALTGGDPPPPPAPAESPIRHILAAPISTADPHRLPGARWMRRAVLRALDHYDRNQRRRLSEISEALRVAAATDTAAVRAAVVELAETVRLSRDDAAQIARRHEELARRMDRDRAAAGSARSDIAELRARTGDLAALAHDTGRRLDAANGRLDDTGRRLDAANGRLDDTGRRLDAANARLDDLQESAAAIAARRDETEQARVADRRDIEQTLRDLDGRLSAQGGDVSLALAAVAARLPVRPGAVAVVTKIGPLLLPEQDTVILPWLRHYHSWEADELDLVGRLLRVGGAFLDVGAHVGYYTVSALRIVGLTGRVIAVEPHSPLRDLLLSNVEAAVGPDTAARLEILPFAAWDADTAVNLTTSTDGNSGDNQVDAIDTQPSADSGRGPSERIEARALAGVEAVAQTRLDVVKVDIQGRDHRALRGLLPVLRRDRPHVITEFWPEGIRAAGESPARVLADYAEWGYVLRSVQGEALTATEALLRSTAAESGFVTLWLDPSMMQATE